jgi:hypothetical protein
LQKTLPSEQAHLHPALSCGPEKPAHTRQSTAGQSSKSTSLGWHSQPEAVQTSAWVESPKQLTPQREMGMPMVHCQFPWTQSALATFCSETQLPTQEGAPPEHIEGDMEPSP